MSKEDLEDLSLINCIGKGAFGEVYLTSKVGYKEKLATKKMAKKFTSSPKLKKYFDNEIGILKEISHPNIVRLIEVKETTTSYYLVFEFCDGGDLSGCLEKYRKKFRRPFTEEMVQHLMRQIVDALNYLHNKHILHRDLKLDNILVTFETDSDKANLNMMKAKVKLIDFGFARRLDPGELAYSTLGSPINMDPGILKKLNKMDNDKPYGYDEKADIWSLGTLCYEMLIGKCTFDANSMNDLVQKVEKGDYFLPTSLSKESVSFVNGMLQYDLKQRLSANKLLNHPFLRKDYKKLESINLKEASKKIQRNQVKINTKSNQSIWILFDTSKDLDEIPSGVDQFQEIIPNIGEQKVNNFIKNGDEGKNGKIDIKPLNQPPVDVNKPAKVLTEEEKLLAQFKQGVVFMNNDYIYIEPKLIPIIPGDDPTVINHFSEFNEDAF